jgi:hypothetical protein
LGIIVARRDLADGSDGGNVIALLGELGHERDGEIALVDRVENIRSMMVGRPITLVIIL